MKSSKALLVHIGRSYGLRVRKAVPYRTLYKRAAAYRIETKQGAYTVKPFPKKERRLAEVAAAVRALRRKGFRHMPRWLATRGGKRWVRWNGKLYYVTTWIPGTMLGTDEKDFRRLGRALAELHSVRGKFPFRPVPGNMNDLQVLRRFYRQFRAHLRSAQKKSTESGQWYREHGQTCLDLAEEGWKILRRSDVRKAIARERKRPVLVHGDVTRPNVISTGDGICFIDWDRVSKGSSYYELAKTLCNTAHFSTPLMRALLEGYEEKRSLGKAERLLVSALFRLPREIWYACRHAARGKSTSLFEIVKITWSDRLAAIQWLDEWARR